MNKPLVLLASAVAMVLGSPLTFAADTGWYAGAGAGQTKARGGASTIDPDLSAEGGTVTSLDDKDTGWKIYAGYQFNPNFALEGMYVSLGKFSVDANISIPAGTEHAEVKPDALCAAGVGILPLANRFSLLGKVGVCRWNDHPRITETTGGATYEEPYPEPTPHPEETVGSTGTNLMFGLGGQYDFASNVSARLEWERYQKVIHDNNGVDLLSVNLLYKF